MVLDAKSEQPGTTRVRSIRTTGHTWASGLAGSLLQRVGIDRHHAATQRAPGNDKPVLKAEGHVSSYPWIFGQKLVPFWDACTPKKSTTEAPTSESVARSPMVPAGAPTWEMSRGTCSRVWCG